MIVLFRLLPRRLRLCFRSHFGLSEMFFSLKPGTFGSPAPERVNRWRGAGSNGPWGALNQTFIMNGSCEVLTPLMKSSAFSPKTSV